MTHAETTIWRRGARLAPLLAFGLLLAIVLTQGAGAQTPPGVEAYHDRVAAAIERIPYRIGDWVGTDVEVPPAAQRLLRPNKVMQRRYRNMVTGQTFNVLVVHTKDSRDMVGHYPPNCYPANGWTPEDASATTFTLSTGAFGAREYRFNRLVEGVRQRLRVFNFFVLPDGEGVIAADYSDLNAASRDRRFTGLGAAQVQLLGGEDMSPAQRREIIDEFTSALEPVIRLIGEGVQS